MTERLCFGPEGKTPKIGGVSLLGKFQYFIIRTWEGLGDIGRASVLIVIYLSCIVFLSDCYLYSYVIVL